jgi:hypothetical protein
LDPNGRTNRLKDNLAEFFLYFLFFFILIKKLSTKKYKIIREGKKVVMRLPSEAFGAFSIQPIAFYFQYSLFLTPLTLNIHNA